MPRDIEEVTNPMAHIILKEEKKHVRILDILQTCVISTTPRSFWMCHIYQALVVATNMEDKQFERRGVHFGHGL